MKILFTGGGTAGHIFPIIAIVRELRKMGSDAEFFYAGPKDDFGEIILSQEGIRIKWILAGKIRRYLGWKNILQNIIDVLFKMPLGFFQSFFYVFTLAPDLIFSKGGYGSLATVLTGQVLQVPIILHESDVAPGLANKFMSKFTRQIFVAFPIAQTEYFSEEKMIAVGNPMRVELLNGNAEKAKEYFDLTGEKPIILVLGGSQGAQAVNDLLLAILPQLLTDFEIIHQTGSKNIEQLKAEAKVMVVDEKLARRYHPIGFLKEVELRDAFKACDLVISRAGGGSIFEIAACQKPSILIPLSSSAQDHQLKNAYAYAQNKTAVVMEEANLTPRFFLEKIKYLFANPDELQKMSQRAKEFSRIDSAKIIAGYIINYLTR
ncbi:MAG: UDP-N-acetylglucosamine--N-acetylmuramyl-(pentapeptide) pyrophosphoryl-undecaprenol N-acetylglucosamine transferase [Candidatus Nealsonbacteria bacterium]